MNIRANDPHRHSWIEISKESDFSMQNLPFGIFSAPGRFPRVGVAIGEFVIDMFELSCRGYFGTITHGNEPFGQSTLNDLMSIGKDGMRELRNRVSDLLMHDNVELRTNDPDREATFVPLSEVTMHLPVRIGDYTDFYSSRDHATNVGKMFRDPENALLPNWLHLPVGYHGRSSSIIVSGEPFHRPNGQTKPNADEPPVFGPSRLLDFEVEMAFITFEGKPLGHSIHTDEADDYIFGMVLMNDWSARDIQKWEYVPLGPFLAKSFASSISPWIVTLDALEPFRVSGEEQALKPLSYLQFNGKKNIDIALTVGIIPEGGKETVVGRTNYKHMYWNMAQQLAHHTINGCNIRCGDMMASGTISGPDEDSFGSMLEISWQGSKSVKMKDGSERKFIQDNDTVVMRGHSEKDGARVGFGEVSTKVLPSLK